jgi:hypothetical protein
MGVIKSTLCTTRSNIMAKVAKKDVKKEIKAREAKIEKQEGKVKTVKNSLQTAK